ncbi:MAG: carboxylesterase family protein [Fimbriimonadaceae bacterium]|nr:carboxylesterase family protein [Fimbriimonadaceae bacterium]
MDRRTFLSLSLGVALAPGRLFDAQGPTVTTRQGDLRGTVEDGLRVFRKVPFALPPTGRNRFRPPLPPQPWTGVRDAFQKALPAMQPGANGSEDCLYLNVWAPSGPGPFPVLMWIHGGGNEGGAAGDNGGLFAREGIVVVLVAYRLGAFGFLELGDVLGEPYVGTGDNGIRDLEAALRWIRENAEAFGGDPSQVTIAGQSAGAKDVAALMAAKSARGLFSRAIMESGSGQTIHSEDSAGEVVRGLLAALDLRTSDANQLLSMPAEAILEGQNRLDARYAHNFPFRPLVGGDYLPKRPVDMVEGTVPLLIGTNRDESIAFLAPADADLPIRSREVSNLDFSKVSAMEARYREAFPGMSTLVRKVRLLTAEEYWIPSVRFAEAHASRGGQTWMVRFDHTPSHSEDPHVGFAAHGAELPFVWSHHPGWTMHETWVAFIQGRSPQWPRYDAHRRATRIFGQDGSTSVEDDPGGRERHLWDGVMVLEPEECLHIEDVEASMKAQRLHTSHLTPHTPTRPRRA